MKIRFFVCLVLTGILINSCKKSKENITIEDIESFEDTPAWELAQAVNKENVEKIKEIASENKTLLDYQEPKLGFTLLMWAIKKEKFESAEGLLESGADPNIKCKSNSTAMYLACEYSWEDVNADKNPRFVKLLLKYGADPNIPDDGSLDSTEKGTTPLMIAVRRSFEKTKVLVEAGADINAKTDTGKTAASEAMSCGFGDFPIEIAHYLVVKKRAKINEPYYFYKRGVVEKNINYDRPHYPIESLRDCIFPLNSKKHILKMEIVEAAKKQGQDYWSVPISETMERYIKLNYPNNWREYLERY